MTDDLTAIDPTKQVLYSSGYRYKTESTTTFETGIKPLLPGGNRFVHIDQSGCVEIGPDYAWDGASGPAINTKNFRRGSLIHDALYQLIREGYLGLEHRPAADAVLYRTVIEDGMWHTRALWVYAAVRVGGGFVLLRPRSAALEVAP
jgi:hypothetical protein